ncbi:MAG: hypothetical protein ACYDDT_08855 [Sulfuricella sp.]
MSQIANEPVTIARLMLAPLQALTNGGRDAARADFSARPWAGAVVSLWYSASMCLIGYLVMHYIKTGKLDIWHSPVAAVSGVVVVWLLYFALNVVILPLYGWLVRYGLRRVLGADMPQEPHPMGVPTGVWLGFAWTAPMLFLALLLYAVMVVQPWFPGLSAFAKSALGTLDALSYFFPLFAIRRIYRLPQSGPAYRRLGIIMMGPPILIAIVGIAVAIVLGAHHRRERTEAANSISSTNWTTTESGTPVVQQNKNAAASDQNQSILNCNGRGPMLVPQAPKELGATVIGVVSPANALASIEQGQQRVNGQLDPDYLYSPRVAVHPDKAPYGTNAMAVVPKGMTVTSGQHIVYRTGYADPNYPCHYFPNLVERVDHQ